MQEGQNFENYVSINHDKRFCYENLSQLVGFAISQNKQFLFLGQIQQNMKNGLGVLLYTNGRIYEGEFESNKKHGKGFEWFST